MASLTRGTSFRRQGSSGSTWTYNEEGVLVRLQKEGQPHVFTAGGSLSRVHVWHDTDSTSNNNGHPSTQKQSSRMNNNNVSGHCSAGSASTAQSTMERSKSVGSHPNRLAHSNSTVSHSTKSRSRVMKWIKKTIIKLKN